LSTQEDELYKGVLEILSFPNFWQVRVGRNLSLIPVMDQMVLLEGNSNGKGHWQVRNEAEQGIMDGIVKEEIVSQFVTCKVQRVIDRSSPNIGQKDNDPP
jgi:hypothetical protein